MINTYHGVCATLLTFYWYLTRFSGECGKPNSIYETVVLSHTFGYLFMDTVFMWHKGFLDNGNLIHHMFGVSSYILCGYNLHNFNFMCIHLLPGELSNANMHGREIIKRMGLRYSKLYYLNDYMYYCEYLVCRIFWIPALYFYFIYPCSSINPG